MVAAALYDSMPMAEIEAPVHWRPRTCIPVSAKTADGFDELSGDPVAALEGSMWDGTIRH